MPPDEFWTSQDGQILTVKPKGKDALALTLAFWPRHPAEFDFMRSRLGELKFSERSSLARIGIEMMISRSAPATQDGRLVIGAEAFLYNQSFPNAPYWKKLLRPGAPVGRLFYAPPAAKLSSGEIWQAVQDNRLKLPNTISIDRQGQVFLTPHHVTYTLAPSLQRLDFERIVSGHAGRSFLDQIQVRHETAPLIPPRAGILTSCSMYLREHYVVLNQGAGNFGLHTSAVLLDPIKTFGTNVMLEIYNPGDQPVVNPMVSVEIFRAPAVSDREVRALARKRQRQLAQAASLFKCFDAEPALDTDAPRPRSKITVRGQSATTENRAMYVAAQGRALRQLLARQACPVGCRTMIQAVDTAPPEADTLIVDFFPDLLEHMELITRLGDINLKRLIFRRASRTHGYFLSSNAHSRLDTFEALGVKIYWYDEQTRDLYLHTYKKGHGFFVREENARKFQEATVFAFYGSALGLDAADTARISTLVDSLTAFFGSNLGMLTGGGGGVMRLASDEARAKGALTGACFLELEAQPPELGVDFFNTFQETSRHFRQKWFEAADFCIFNVGGVGTLEEAGIELCNLKLGIRHRVPYVFFNAGFWRDLRQQFLQMIRTHRAPAWMEDYVLFTDDPAEVIAFYREKLQVL